MSNSFQFLSYYLHGLSLSLFITFESEIYKLSFQPANPHPYFFSSEFSHVSKYSVVFTYLHPKGSPTMSSANIMDAGSYFLTPSVSPSMSMRNRYGLKADHCCNRKSTMNMLLSLPATRAPWLGNLNAMSCISLTYYSGRPYVALTRASPDLVPRYPIVCLGMKIASLVLLRICMLALLLRNVIFLRHFAAIGLCIVPICGVIIKMIL